MPNYRPIWLFGNITRGAPPSRAGNSQVFATKREAEQSARDRMIRWTAPYGFEVDETDAEVNYTWDDITGNHMTTSVVSTDTPTTIKEEK